MALLLIFVFGGLLSLNRHYHDPAYSKTRGWRELAAAIERYAVGMAESEVRIAQNFPDPTLWYYYHGSLDHVVLPPAAHDSEGATSSVSSLAQAGVQRVILPLQPDPNWDDAGIASAALTEAFAPIHEEQVGVWPVTVYEPADRDLSPIDIEFENGLKVTGFALTPQTLQPGGLLSVQLRWQGDPDNLAGDEKVTVQLLGPDGQVLAQQDRALDVAQISAPSATSDAYGMLLPMDLAQGDYRLIVALYVPTEDGSRRIPTAIWRRGSNDLAGQSTIIRSGMSAPYARGHAHWLWIASSLPINASSTTLAAQSRSTNDRIRPTPLAAVFASR